MNRETYRGFVKNSDNTGTSTFGIKDLKRLREEAKSYVPPEPMIDWIGTLRRTAELHRRKRTCR